MPDPDAITRSTHYVKDATRLAQVMNLPIDTDPSKVMRLAADRIENGGEGAMTEERLLGIMAKFYRGDRA